MTVRQPALADLEGAQFLERILILLDGLFNEHRIWYSLGFGTLLGAVRDQDLIPWDYDVDMLIKPADVQRLLDLNDEVARDGLEFRDHIAPASHLALCRGGFEEFKTCKVECYFGERRVADFYYYTLFRDGVYRRYDFVNEVYWCPHYSIPHFFVEPLEYVTIRGRRYPGLACATEFFEGLYGKDWVTPYKAMVQGGKSKAGTTIHAAHYKPRLRDEVAWSLDQGWDPASCADSPAWPRAVQGAGPIGPSERTRDNSRALWWRDFDELCDHY